jgi:hypothetical protein
VVKKKIILISILLFTAGLYPASAPADDYEPASVKIQSALFIKVLGFNVSLDRKVAVYVMGDEDFAGEFKTLVGYEIGEGKLVSVRKGSSLPATVPDVLYIGDDVDVRKALLFTEENRVMSISGNPELIGRGISLIIAVHDGKPKLIIDTEGSIREGVEWHKKMIEISVIH